MTDYLEYAHNLKIIPVHQQSAANTSGYHTPAALYTPYTPFQFNRIIIHATVGVDTLPYFADEVDAHWNVIRAAGSVLDGRQVLAHQLVPKDDFTIYDMVPQGYGCGHCNPGVLKGQGALNFHAQGIEVENLQNGDGGDQFTEAQYIKLALTVAYKTAVAHIPNRFVGTHFDATCGAYVDGSMAGHSPHVDPYSGPFDMGRFWGHLWGIRQTPAVFAYWGVPVYDGS